MNSKQTFITLGIAVITIVGFSVYVTYSGATAMKERGENLTDLKLKYAVIDDRQNALIQAERDIKQYSDLEQIAKTIVPQEKDQARTVREITAIAEESGIPISSIQFPASALGNIKKGARTLAATNPEASQLTPVQGISGLYAMEITVASDRQQPVPYEQLLQFLENLEQNRRTAHVTNLAIQPDTNRDLVTFTVTLNVYIKL